MEGEVEGNLEDELGGMEEMGVIEEGNEEMVMEEESEEEEIREVVEDRREEVE